MITICAASVCTYRKKGALLPLIVTPRAAETCHREAAGGGADHGAQPAGEGVDCGEGEDDSEADDRIDLLD